MWVKDREKFGREGGFMISLVLFVGRENIGKVVDLIYLVLVVVLRFGVFIVVV